MNIFAGKTPTERNKIIAAAVLGVLSLFSLYMAFGGSLFSRKPAVNVSVSSTPTPTPANTGAANAPITPEEIYRDYTTTPVVYIPGAYGAPDAGRNIFAFYEPPPPTPYVPPPPTIPSPTPTPTPPPPPPQNLAFITPQSVYSGSKTFRLDVSGSGFTPETRILFNGSELPTTFINPQQLAAEIPANLISAEGPRQIMTATPDGQLYSNQLLLTVEAPPQPKFQYIGMIARRHYNNDTAYFLEPNSPPNKEPTGARLNDVVGDRFRIISISAKEVVLEDVNLGFRHKLALFVPPPGQSAPASRNQNFPQGGNYVQPYTPPQIPNYQPAPQDIPGIPNNIPRYNPQQPNNQNPSNRQPQKQPVEDDEDDDGDGKP
jgi:hypothetical protein